MGQDHARLAGQRILVVEDEALIAMEIESILEDLHCEVVGSVATIEAALAAIAGDDRLDGVFLDLNLAGRTALPIAEELLRLEIPFILLTGYASNPSDSPVLRGARRLKKPFRAQNLAEAMAEAFDRPSGARAQG